MSASTLDKSIEGQPTGADGNTSRQLTCYYNSDGNIVTDQNVVIDPLEVTITATITSVVLDLTPLNHSNYLEENRTSVDPNTATWITNSAGNRLITLPTPVGNDQFQWTFRARGKEATKPADPGPLRANISAPLLVTVKVTRKPPLLPHK